MLLFSIGQLEIQISLLSKNYKCQHTRNLSRRKQVLQVIGAEEYNKVPNVFVVCPSLLILALQALQIVSFASSH